MAELTALPAEVLQKHLAFLASSDAGKTYAAKTAVEDLLDAGARVCIVDPKGAWYGLRLNPDGRKASPYQLVIFGGDHADVALDGVDGTRLAQLVAEGDFSCIIDTRRLTVGQRTRLFADFAEGLSRFNSRALHLVIDEAHLFAPQGRVQDFDSGRMLHAANELVSGGRSLGLRVMLLTQRAAKLHKDTLSVVQAIVAMLNISPQDRKAVADWIKAEADMAKGQEIMASLSGLQVGHGWVWAPRLGILERVHFRRLKTFDSSAAPAEDGPKHATVPLSAATLAQLRRELAPPPADEPATKAPPVRKRSVDIVTEHAVVYGLDAAREDGRREGHAAGLELGRAQGAQETWALISERFTKAIAGRLSSFQYLLEQDLHDIANPEAVARQAVAAPAEEADRPAPPPKPAAAPRPPSQARAATIVQLLDTLGRARRPLTWNELGLLNGLSPISGHFLGIKREMLDTAPPLRRVGDKIALPEELEAEAVVLPELDVAEIVAAWAAKLRAPSDRMLQLLYERGPMNKAQIGEALSLSPISGHFLGGIKRLKPSGLIRDVDGKWDVARIFREVGQK